jgi:hypothetical protein
MKLKCRHKECRSANKMLCAPSHRDCIWVGCTDTLHSMANGPGGYIPSVDNYPIGNTD